MISFNDNIACDIMMHALGADTCVLVSAIRSPGGASDVLVEFALNNTVEVLISTPLVLEYEATLKRAEHIHVSGFSTLEVDSFIDAICKVGVEAPTQWKWRPQLNDPGDEMVLDTAINGGAEAIVTFNRSHFEEAARRFGIAVLWPSEVLKKVRSK